MQAMTGGTGLQGNEGEFRQVPWRSRPFLKEAWKAGGTAWNSWGMASNLEYLEKVWEGDKEGKGQIRKA